MLPQPKTDVAVLPLIDHPPAHHDTTKTAIDKGLSLMRAAGDDVLIFTADQQLYKIVEDLMFYQPTYFESVIPGACWNAYAHDFFSCRSCHHGWQ